ncbi:SDR family oxidoreductase [Inquilinus sp. Marseille-Q2685]|uniref:SDR family oxidoreductase n=1 Tax=Inquilinus sp. Marseille-Q2685 TaxID=2866581 RepID=UPI001CE4405F|nr:SDR family oxidoreductase [Inquilinus sp. Marseille-Q2685]
MNEHPPGVVVITGASAGVGRATAVAFARRRWNVALIARGMQGLEGAGQEVERAGGKALTISADVADAKSVFEAADRIARQWGGINVWINNAMVTTFSPVADISPDEFRRVTEVTYLGCVFGTMAALKHDVRTIVQVGSALAYRAIPLQSAYCGAKFAIRGFTDALRSELLHDRSDVRITMVQLPAVNTPQFGWARNKMRRRPQPVPPIHQPETVAEAIFRASQRTPRELWVGWPSVKAILGAMIAPRLLDRLLARGGYDGQLSSEPHDQSRPDNLFRSAPEAHATHGRFDDRARSRAVTLNPSLVRGAIAIAAAAVLLAVALFTPSLTG